MESRYHAARQEWAVRVAKHLGGEVSYEDTFSPEIAAHITALRGVPKEELTANDARVQAIFKAFAEQIDPSHERTHRPNKYLAWACKAYLAGRHNNTQILAEDIYKIAGDLSYFEALSTTLNKDGKSNQIEQIVSLQALRDLLQPYEQKRNTKQTERQERSMSADERAAIMAETTVLYKGREGTVVVPHTVRASRYWGNETRWCISDDRATERFPSYNQKSPIIIAIPKGAPKLAIVEEELYNDQDIKRTHYTAPEALLLGALKKAKPALAGALQLFIPEHGIGEEIATAAPVPLPDLSHLSYQLQQEASNILLNLKSHFWLDKLFYNISQELTQDQAFILAAVTQKGVALEYADDKLKKDPTIVLAAAEQNRFALEFADQKLKEDPDFIVGAMISNPMVIVCADDNIIKAEYFQQPLAQACPFHPFIVNQNFAKPLQIAALQKAANAPDYEATLLPFLRHAKELWGTAGIFSASEALKIMQEKTAPPQARVTSPSLLPRTAVQAR
jgi:hypothetical protein